MALRLACQGGSNFAAYALVGPNALAVPGDCRLAPPRLLFVVGTAADEAGTAGIAKAASETAVRADAVGVLAGQLGCKASSQITQVIQATTASAAQAQPSTQAQPLPQVAQSGKLSKTTWTGCKPGSQIEMLRPAARIAVDRAVPDVWSFFRRIGG